MCSAVKMTAAPPRKRCRSVSHAGVGRPRVSRVLRSRPQMTDAVSSPHATNPVARARNHHSCEFMSLAPGSLRSAAVRLRHGREVDHARCGRGWRRRRGHARRRPLDDDDGRRRWRGGGGWNRRRGGRSRGGHDVHQHHGRTHADACCEHATTHRRVASSDVDGRSRRSWLGLRSPSGRCRLASLSERGKAGRALVAGRVRPISRHVHHRRARCRDRRRPRASRRMSRQSMTGRSSRLPRPARRRR